MTTMTFKRFYEPLIKSYNNFFKLKLPRTPIASCTFRRTLIRKNRVSYTSHVQGFRKRVHQAKTSLLSLDEDVNITTQPINREGPSMLRQCLSGRLKIELIAHAISVPNAGVGQSITECKTFSCTCGHIKNKQKLVIQYHPKCKVSLHYPYPTSTISVMQYILIMMHETSIAYSEAQGSAHKLAREL